MVFGSVEKALIIYILWTFKNDNELIMNITKTFILNKGFKKYNISFSEE